jgi:hypothetical protein
MFPTLYFFSYLWIGTWLGVHGCVTNKGETNYMEGTGIAKLIVVGDGDCETNNCETNNCQNRPWNLHQAHPAQGLILTAWSCIRARLIAVQRCFIDSDLRGL